MGVRAGAPFQAAEISLRPRTRTSGQSHPPLSHTGEDLVPEPPLQAQAASQGEGHDRDVRRGRVVATQGGSACAGEGREAVLRVGVVGRGHDEPGDLQPLQPPPGQVRVHVAGVKHRPGRGDGAAFSHRQPSSSHAHGLRCVKALFPSKPPSTSGNVQLRPTQDRLVVI